MCTGGRAGVCWGECCGELKGLANLQRKHRKKERWWYRAHKRVWSRTDGRQRTVAVGAAEVVADVGRPRTHHTVGNLRLRIPVTQTESVQRRYILCSGGDNAIMMGERRSNLSVG